MQIEFTFSYSENYLPSKRHKKLRQRMLSETHTFELKFLDIEQFPKAFITHELHRQEQKRDEYYLSDHVRVYRACNDRVFRQVYACNHIDEIQEYIRLRIHSFKYNTDPEISKETIITHIQDYLDTFVITNTFEVWRETYEPIYEVRQDYARCMRNGKAVFIGEGDSAPTPYRFNALQRDDAQAYCEQQANKEGADVGPCAHIEVLIPEMVKCDPQTEYIVAALSK